MMRLLKTTESGLLKFSNLDAVAGNVLAEMLEIEHSKMMRTIKRVVKNERARQKDTATSGFISNQSHYAELRNDNLNFNAVFKEWEYKDSMNRTRKTYIMNEDALYLVIANSQSAKAHELKVWFKSEFNNMRLERSHRADAKVLSRPVTDQLQKLFTQLIAEGSSQQEHLLYMTFNKKTYKAITGEKFHKDKLDQLSYDQACDLAELRDNAASQLEFMFCKGFPSGEIRSNLWKFIDSFNRG